MTSGRLLVIGYGSPLRSDDTIGPRAADALGTLHPDWDVITAVQLTPELAEPISRAERVIFIDAAIGETPGAIHSEWVVPAALEHGFTHHATPSSLLASAAELYHRAPDALLITIVGESFELGSDLSPTLENAFPTLIDSLQKLLC